MKFCKLLLICFSFFIFIPRMNLTKTDFAIGVLYQEEAGLERRAIKLAISTLNKRNKLFNFHLLHRNITSGEPLDSLVKGCSLADFGASFFVSAAKGKTAYYLKSVSNQLSIPLLTLKDSSYFGTSVGHFSFSTQPDKSSLYKVFQYICREKKINNFIAVYESGNEQSRRDDFFKKRNNDENFSNYDITIITDEKGLINDDALRQTSSNILDLINKDYRIVFDAVLLFTSTLSAKTIMRNIYNNPSNYQTPRHWVIVDDDSSERMEEKMRRFALWSITIIKQFINNTDESVHNFAHSWNHNMYNICDTCEASLSKPSNIPTAVYRIRDALFHLSSALEELVLNKRFISAARLHCSSRTSWRGGTRIMQQMRKTCFDWLIKKINSSGLLSKICLNRFGYNQCATYEIREKDIGINKKFKQRKIWKFGSESNQSKIANNIQNSFFRVVTVTETPFVIENSNGSNFTGFSIELFDKLAQKYKFRYSIYKVPDGNYGSKLENGTWNGIIWELITGRADIAVAGMTITADREKVVDFPKRYMDYSVGIALQRPQLSTSLFSFVEPFHSSVWFCVVLCLILVVVFVYYLQQISPSNFKNNKKRKKEDEDLYLSTVFWYVYSTFMQQGSELKTKSLPVRIAIGFWWLFALVVVSSYTANLAAFLTVQRMDLPIRSLNDLVKQKAIGYGTVAQTSFYDNILKKGKEASDDNSKYKKMSHVITSPENRLNSWREGFRRTAEGNFAFLWDVAVIEYEVLKHENCLLTMISDTAIFEKGYGFALRQGSPYRDVFSTGILDLQESGEIKKLKKKYWTKSSKCGLNDEGTTTKAAERTLENFTGVFFLLAAGLFLSFAIAVCELVVYFVKKKKRNSKNIENQKRVTTKNEKQEHVFGLHESQFSGNAKKTQLTNKEDSYRSQHNSSEKKSFFPKNLSFMKCCCSVKFNKRTNKHFVTKNCPISIRHKKNIKAHKTNVKLDSTFDPTNFVLNDESTRTRQDYGINQTSFPPVSVDKLFKKTSV